MPSDTRGRAWEAYLVTTTRLTSHMETVLKAECKLSLPEYNVLLQTSRAGDCGIRLGALAHEVVFSRSRLTHTLKRLQDRGLIQRSACAEDLRGGLITLTAEGTKLFARASDIHRTLVRSLAIDGMTDEEATALRSFFDRLASRLAD